MVTIQFSDLIKDFEWRGAQDFDERELGVSPRRLPAWCRPQIPQVMDWVVRMPSGVRLRFATDATEIHVHALATNNLTPPDDKRPVVFDLRIEGKTMSQSNLSGNTILLNRTDPTDIQLKRGEPGVWSFTGLSQGKKQCELWLPHNAVVELRHLELNDGASIEVADPDSKVKWLHYGSSISHCIEAEQPTLTWPAAAAAELNLNLQSLGFGGQCHLDPFIARVIAQSDADLISLKVGINVINMDSMRERVFTPLLHGFLDTIRESKPETPIILISPIFCPSAEDNPGPTLPNEAGKFLTFERPKRLNAGSLTLTRVREIFAEEVTRRSDTNLFYLNGLELFSEADASDLPDELHPNPEGYLRMASRFSRALRDRKLV